MSGNLLVINVDIREVRVALIENGIIAELHIERLSHRSTLGNIYLGKVSRVLPGMQAAFIDIGQERAAFLHVEDLIRPADFDLYFTKSSDARAQTASPKLDEGEDDADASEEGGEGNDGGARATDSSDRGASREGEGEAGPRRRRRRRRGRGRGEGAARDGQPAAGEVQAAPTAAGDEGEQAADEEAAVDDDGAEIVGGDDTTAGDDRALAAGSAEIEGGAANVDAGADAGADDDDEPIMRFGSIQPHDDAGGDDDHERDSERDEGDSEREDDDSEGDSDRDEDAAGDDDSERDEDADDADRERDDDDAGDDDTDIAREDDADSARDDQGPSDATAYAEAPSGDDERAATANAGTPAEALAATAAPGERPVLTTHRTGVARSGRSGRSRRTTATGAAAGRNDRGPAATQGSSAQSSSGQAGRRADGRRQGGRRTTKGKDHDGGKPAEASRISKATPIREVVREGQHVIVQVTKEPIGTKGARVSSHVSLAGRYVVYLPTVEHVGISKRIGSDQERARLRDAIDSVKPPTGGLVVRTVAEGLTKKKLKNDVGYLVRLWDEILEARKNAKRAPDLVFEELDLVLKTARDLFGEDVGRIIIDNREQYARLRRFVEMFMPERAGDVELYEGKEPVFDAFGIEDEIARALARKVPLTSGGYLIIDQAEALTAIDVNTGRFVGKGSKDLEDTILATNLEAVQEIAYQLRFRNIGGLIILDLIDMDRAQNREKVRHRLEELLANDKAKTTLNRISELGLIEMTRKRTRESLGRLMHEPCFYCDGTGQLMSKETIAYEILRQIRREQSNLKGYKITVNAHPAIVDLLKGAEQVAVKEAERMFMRRIDLVPRKEFHMEQFDLHGG